jgi:hypothetical protein
MLPGYAKPLRFEIDPADGERLQQDFEWIVGLASQNGDG